MTEMMGAWGMTQLASLFPLGAWLLYGVCVAWLERSRPSLSNLMSHQRRRWVANAVHRNTPLDAILSGNLMSSVSFFASTTVLLILALFAVFGQISSVLGAVQDLHGTLTSLDLEIHIVALITMFGLAFLAFTLSLRQFNHFCILLGAMTREGEKVLPDDIMTIARVNTNAARNFNNGIRAYYFAIPAAAWFVSPLLCMAMTAVIVALLLQREFFSPDRALIAQLTKD